MTVITASGDGAVIPNCSVVFKRNSDRIIAKTDAHGTLNIRIAPGHYVVTVSHPGFKSNRFVDFSVSEPSALLNVVLAAAE